MTNTSGTRSAVLPHPLLLVKVVSISGKRGVVDPEQKRYRKEETNMRHGQFLFILCSICVLAMDLSNGFLLDDIIEKYSLENLKQHVVLDSMVARQKRQKDGDPSTIQKEKPAINENEAHAVTTMMPVGDDSGAHCLVACLRPMVNKQPQDATNETLICPKYDENRIGDLCQSYLTAKKCLDECPESRLKNLSMSGFKPLQFMCVDRREDFKKYMPCLTNVCDEVQRQCEPTCGSLDESVRRLARIQHQVRGPGGRSRGADLDVPEIMQTVADNCQLVGCMGNCSRDPITKQCGGQAYDLQRDTIWTMLSSMAQAMSSIGLNDVWPAQCQNLVTADKQRHQSQQTSGTETADPGPNDTNRFGGKQMDKTNNTTPSETGTGREEPHDNEVKPESNALPASGSSSKGASGLLVLFSIFILAKMLRPK